MSTSEDKGRYVEGWVDPIDQDDLPEITEAEHEEVGDPVPPPDRLAQEPEKVKAENHGQRVASIFQLTPPGGPEGLRGFVPSVQGIDLRNYRQTPTQRGWGAPCTARLARVALPGGAAVTVDSRLAEMILLIMSANVRDGYAYRAIDTGAYNCRKIASSNSWSWHAWAIAVDENWQTNPYTSPLRTDKPVWLRNRWNRYGFAWGGDYSGAQDAMHFEYMGTPETAAQGTALARVELDPFAPAAVPSFPSTSFPMIGDRTMRVIHSNNRGAALVGAGYFFRLPDQENATEAQNLWGAAVECSDRQWDVWRYQALEGEVATNP